MRTTKDAEKLQAALKNCLARPIANGPVKTTAKAYAALWVLSALTAGCTRAICLARPGNTAAKVLHEFPPDTVIHWDREFHTLERRLRELKPGTQVEILSADETDLLDGGNDAQRVGGRALWSRIRDASRLRLAGIVSPDDGVELIHSYPAATAEQWHGVCQVLATLRSDSESWAANVAEAKAIVRLAKSLNWRESKEAIKTPDNVLHAKGRDIQVHPSRRMYLALLTLRARFPSGPWDHGPANQAQEQIAEANRKAREAMLEAMKSR